jgi:fructokinase
MESWGLAVDNLQRDTDYPTGTVQVAINQGEPEYKILADQAYDFIAAQQLDAAAQYNVIYHGTLALRHSISEQTLQTLITDQQSKVFIDVNLRAPWWNPVSVCRHLKQADWVKLNHNELLLLAPETHAVQTAMHLFLEQHLLEVLVVTCGSRGALAINKTGKFIEVAPTNDSDIVDTVGAGDAFSAVLLLGLQLDWSLQLTMERAQSFASALVTQTGGTVQDVNFYRPFIAAWNLD